MAAPIVFSPSQQAGNQYSGGGTGFSDSEQAWMEKLADYCKVRWDQQGTGIPCVVLKTGSVGGQVAKSNALNARVHIAQHTNAGGGDGSLVIRFPGSAAGAKLANCVYPFVALASDRPDDGITANEKYYETRKTHAPAIIIEYAFHDNPAEAQEIRTSIPEYGEATIKGLCKYFGKTYKPPVAAPGTAYINHVVHIDEASKAKFDKFAADNGKAARNYHSAVALPAAASGSWKAWPPNN